MSFFGWPFRVTKLFGSSPPKANSPTDRTSSESSSSSAGPRPEPSGPSQKLSLAQQPLTPPSTLAKPRDHRIFADEHDHVVVKTEQLDEYDGGFAASSEAGFDTDSMMDIDHDDGEVAGSPAFIPATPESPDQAMPSIENSPGPESMEEPEAMEEDFDEECPNQQYSGEEYSGEEYSDEEFSDDEGAEPLQIIDQVGSASVVENLRPEPDSLPESCSWKVQPADLEQYQSEKDAIPGSETWTMTEVALHRLLVLRGCHPILPSPWKWDFSDVNLEDYLFAPWYSNQQTALRACRQHSSANFRATKQLMRIFDLPARVSDLRRTGLYPKIALLIAREIQRFIDWAMWDAGLDGLQFVPNLLICQNIASDPAILAAQLQQEIGNWVEHYRGWYADMGIRKLAPSTLFAFAIIQHRILVLTIDAGLLDAPIRRLAEVNMSRSDGRWLDHSLNLAIPIHMARDAMMGLKEHLPPKEVVDDDPDLNM